MADWVILGSGPSLTAEDVQATRHLPTIAVNSTWQLAPHASIVYAADAAWWDHNHPTGFAERWTSSRSAADRHQLHYQLAPNGVNSGAQAIRLAIWLKATRILLLGFDCSVAAGTHWHGDHPATKNPTAELCQTWAKQFAAVAREAKAARVEVLNASRSTALTCFPLTTLTAAWQSEASSVPNY